MSEQRRCEGCGKAYWWPAARWQHEKCVVVHTPDGLVVHSKHGVYADLEKRKVYRREWTRRKREEKKTPKA